MNTNNIEFAKCSSREELIERLDYALLVALELNRQIDAMGAELEERHRLPLAA